MSPLEIWRQGRLLERREPDHEKQEWRVFDGAGDLLAVVPFSAEERESLQADKDAAAAEEALLRALVQPVIDQIDQVLTARGLTRMSAPEHAALEDRLVYLSSRGQYGNST